MSTRTRSTASAWRARCELRDCRLDGVRGADRLRGAAMPWSDIVAMAGIWAGELGIQTLDAE